MELFTIIFYVFTLLTLVSASFVVFSRNIVHSAFSLLFTFFGVAGLYVLLMADFIAITQLMIYVGGILVLLVFGVMLTSRQINVDAKTGTIQTLPAVLIAAALAGSLVGMFWSTDWPRTGSLPDTLSSGKNIGTLLLTSYVLPFEIASVVLLVALVGAAMIARREERMSDFMNEMINFLRHPGLTHFLIVSALLFSMGVFAILTRRNAVMVLMGIELVLNAANINFVAFSRYSTGTFDGQVISIFVIILAAAEVAIALAIVLNIYQNFNTVNVDEINQLKD